MRSTRTTSLMLAAGMMGMLGASGLQSGDRNLRKNNGPFKTRKKPKKKNRRN